jgi:hypothetical protein
VGLLHSIPDLPARSLYPTHDGYVAQVAKVTLDNLQNQYIEAPDAQQTVLDAINSAVGKESRGGDYNRYLAEFGL